MIYVTTFIEQALMSKRERKRKLYITIWRSPGIEIVACVRSSQSISGFMFPGAILILEAYSSFQENALWQSKYALVFRETCAPDRSIFEGPFESSGHLSFDLTKGQRFRCPEQLSRTENVQRKLREQPKKAVFWKGAYQHSWPAQPMAQSPQSDKYHYVSTMIPAKVFQSSQTRLWWLDPTSGLEQRFLFGD